MKKKALLCKGNQQIALKLCIDPIPCPERAQGGKKITDKHNTRPGIPAEKEKHILETIISYI